MTFSNHWHKRKKSRTSYWPTLHATMEMAEYLQDKILARGARWRRALARLRRAPTGADQSHEDDANRGDFETDF